MKSVSESCIVSSSKDRVFGYLSKPENLPTWAPEFIKSIKKDGKMYKAQTLIGEMFVNFETDEQKGIVDMYAGPTMETMTLAPLRVIPVSESESAIVFSFFQYPNVADEEIEIFAAWIKEHMKTFHKLFC